MGHAQLLRNNGDGTFTDVSAKAGFTDPSIGTVCAWFDYDNDGWLDVLQYVWSDYEDIIETMKTGARTRRWQAAAHLSQQSRRYVHQEGS